MNCSQGYILIGSICFHIGAWTLVIGTLMTIVGWIGRLGYDNWLNRKKDSEMMKRETLLDDIARHRTRGVALRNDGCNLSYYHEPIDWFVKVEQWTDEAYDLVAKISFPSAERIRTLGKVTSEPPSNCRLIDSEHGLIVRMLTQRTELLDEFVREWSPYVAGFSEQPPTIHL